MPNEETEELTEEEREFLSPPGRVVAIDPELVAKLLRIHDRLQADLELQQELTRAHIQAQMLAEGTAKQLREANHASKDLRQDAQHRCAALQDEIHQLHLAWAAQIRDLAPRVGLRALEGVPDEVKALLEARR